MKNSYLLSAILLILIHTVSGQSTSLNYPNLNEQDTIYGVVTDYCEGFLMEGVSIKATGTHTFTTTTNDVGYYELVVDTGTYNFEFSATGYDTIHVLGLPITGDSNIEINGNMKQISYPPINVLATLDPSETTCYITWEMNSKFKNNNKKDLVNFVVAEVRYFTPCNDPSSGILTPLSGTPSSFDVSFWLSGFYSFAVKAVYECGESNWIYSNTFSLKLSKEVTFNISLCDDSVLENSEITLIGQDCPWNTYDSMTDTMGIMVFDNITEGYYELQINRPGYNPYEIDSISVITDTIINIELTQNMNPPHNMYVDTLTNIATWNKPTTADSARIIKYFIFLDEVLIDSVSTNLLSYNFLELATGQSYNACVEAKYACGISEAVCYSWESQLLSINDYQEIGLINVFPNPAKNYITITSTMPINNIRINNYVGQEMYNSIFNGVTSQNIVTSDYQTGVYIIEITTKAKVITKKVIITN